MTSSSNNNAEPNVLGVGFKTKLAQRLVSINILGTFIIVILLIISASNPMIFKYYDITFPLNMPFFSTLAFDLVYLVDTSYRQVPFPQVMATIHLLNTFNLVFFLFQFILFASFEAYKI